MQCTLNLPTCTLFNKGFLSHNCSCIWQEEYYGDGDDDGGGEGGGVHESDAGMTEPQFLELLSYKGLVPQVSTCI